MSARLKKFITYNYFLCLRLSRPSNAEYLQFFNQMNQTVPFVLSWVNWSEFSNLVTISWNLKWHKTLKMNKRKEQNTLTFSQKIVDQKYDTLQSLMENWKKNRYNFIILHSPDLKIDWQTPPCHESCKAGMWPQSLYTCFRTTQTLKLIDKPYCGHVFL